MELSEQKEEYGRLLRGENSKWKVEKEQLESEISKLKKTPTSKTTSISSKSHDADLTAFIKDLKESANNLSNTNLTSTGKTQGKRPASNNNRFLSNTVRRTTISFWIICLFLETSYDCR